jgi:ribonucleoside-diphosphate reductase alpha chain
MNKTTDIQIIKRDGTKEPLDINKMHFVVEQACDGLTGVSASQIEMNSHIQFTSGMTSKDIQDILIRSANDLITLENPNYQFAAARLLLWNVYKEVFNQFQPKPFIDIINQNVDRGVYDKQILENYSDTELKKLNTWIKHDRDLDFTYAIH